MIFFFSQDPEPMDLIEIVDNDGDPIDNLLYNDPLLSIWIKPEGGSWTELTLIDGTENVYAAESFKRVRENLYQLCYPTSILSGNYAHVEVQYSTNRPLRDLIIVHPNIPYQV